MDKEIKDILEKITNENYEAFIVGGYVRDHLLGIASFDIDICTNALPQQLETLFNIKTNPFGGLNLKIENYTFTITPFRTDSNYKKGFPKTITFQNDLREDLKRRDFTINAICMDKNGHLIDYLNGVKDLEERKIKMIGDPIKRIEEDPLRIYRAIRFATKLNFEIESDLQKAIMAKRYLLQDISENKKRKEEAKILELANNKEAIKLANKFGIKINLQK